MRGRCGQGRKDMEIVFKIAIRYMTRNIERIRSACVCLGIMMLLIVLVLGISNGVEDYLLSKYEALGDSYVLLNTTWFSEEFLEELSEISGSEVRISVEYEDFDWDFVKKVIATSDETVSFMNSDYYENNIKEGRFFNEYEKNNGDNKIIIDEVTEEELFGDSIAIGKTVVVLGEEYIVVGVMSSKEKSESMVHADDEDMTKTGTVYVPVSNFPEEIINGCNVTYYISPKEESFSAVEEFINEEMQNQRVDDFSLISSEEVSEEVNDIKSVLRNVFWGISAFSVVTGILVLINTTKLIIMDLNESLLFFKVQGISTGKTVGIIYIIGSLVALIGLVLALVAAGIIKLGFDITEIFSVNIKVYELLFMLCFALIMSGIAFLINKKQLDKLNMMDFFRG